MFGLPTRKADGKFGNRGRGKRTFSEDETLDLSEESNDEDIGETQEFKYEASDMQDVDWRNPDEDIGETQEFKYEASDMQDVDTQRREHQNHLRREKRGMNMSTN
eukprot:CFRG5883T1